MASNEQPPRPHPPEDEQRQLDKVEEIQHDRRIKAVAEAVAAEIVEEGARAPVRPEKTSAAASPDAPPAVPSAADEFVGPPKPAGKAEDMPAAAPSAPAADTALARAFASAKKLTGKAAVVKTTKAPSRRNSEKRSGDAFDTGAQVAKIDDAYRALGEEIRKQGGKPEAMPTRAWIEANAALDTARNLAKQYEKSNDPSVRTEIAARMKRLEIKMGGSIAKRITEEARKHAPAAPEAQTARGADAPKPARPKAPSVQKSRSDGVKARAARVPRTPVVPRPNKATAVSKRVAAPAPATPEIPQPDITTAVPAAAADAFTGRETRQDFAFPAAPSVPQPDIETAVPRAARADDESRVADKSASLEALDIPPDLGAVRPGIPDEPEELVGPPKPLSRDEESELIYARAAAETAAERKAQFRAVVERARSILSSSVETISVGYEQAKRYLAGRSEALSGVIGPMIGRAREAATPERIKEVRDRITTRVKELDTKLALRTESGFRWLGTKYDKLSTREKIGIGLVLGLGAGAGFAAGSLLAGYGFMTAAAGQRAAGLSSLFQRYERTAVDGARKKERAMMKAVAMSAGMTAGAWGLALGAEKLFSWISEAPSGEAVRESTPSPAPNAAPAASAPAESSAAPSAAPEAPSAAQSIEPSEVLAAAAPSVPDAGPASPMSAGEASYASEGWEPVGDTSGGAPVFERITPIGDGDDFVPESESSAEAASQGEAPTGETASAASPEVQPPSPVEDAARPLPPLSESATVGGDDTILRDSQGNAIPDSQGDLVHTGTFAPEAAEQPPAPVEDAAPARPALDKQPALETQPLLQDSVIEQRELPTDSMPTEGTSVQQDGAGAEVAGPSTEVRLYTQTGELIDAAKPAIYESRLPSGETYLAAFGGTDEERFAYIRDFVSKPENAGKAVRWAREVPGVGTIVQNWGAEEKGGFLSHFFGSLLGSQPPAPSPETFLRKIGK